MASYHFRAHCSGLLQDQIVDFLARNSEGETIVCRELAEREHIHALVHTRITKKSFCNKFKAKFSTMDGNKDYSFTPVKNSDADMCQYICKATKMGDQPIILMSRALKNTIEEYHNEYWMVHALTHPSTSVKQEIQEIQQKSQTSTFEIIEKPKKKKVPPFMVTVREDLIQEYGSEYQWELEDKWRVFSSVVDHLGDFVKALDHIIVGRMTNGILCSLMKDRKKFKCALWDKCFQEHNPFVEKAVDLYTMTDQELLAFHENQKPKKFKSLF